MDVRDLYFAFIHSSVVMRTTYSYVLLVFKILIVELPPTEKYVRTTTGRYCHALLLAVILPQVVVKKPNKNS